MMENYTFSSDFFRVCDQHQLLCTMFNTEPNRYIDLKKNAGAAYFTYEFPIVIPIRWEM